MGYAEDIAGLANELTVGTLVGAYDQLALITGLASSPLATAGLKNSFKIGEVPANLVDAMLPMLVIMPAEGPGGSGFRSEAGAGQACVSDTMTEHWLWVEPVSNNPPITGVPRLAAQLLDAYIQAFAGCQDALDLNDHLHSKLRFTYAIEPYAWVENGPAYWVVRLIHSPWEIKAPGQ